MVPSLGRLVGFAFHVTSQNRIVSIHAPARESDYAQECDYARSGGSLRSSGRAPDLRPPLRPPLTGGERTKAKMFQMFHVKQNEEFQRKRTGVSSLQIWKNPITADVAIR